MDSHLHAVSGVSSCLQRNQDESKQRGRVETAVRSQDASQQTTKRGIWVTKTIRRVDICLVRRPEAGLYQPVDVVSPIDATGHPQLARVLRLGA
jgi:hypothetical protein